MRAQPMRALKRLVLRASLLVCLLESGHLTAAPRPVPGEQVGSGYDIEMSRMIPMRDGVQLEGQKRVYDLTAALIRRGYTDEHLRLILGQNWRRVLGEIWHA